MKRFICIVPLLFALVLARQTSSGWFGDLGRKIGTPPAEEVVKRSPRSLDNDAPGDGLNKYVLENSCLNGLRAQLNLEMHASLIYMQMAAHFDSNQVARKGFAKFFQHNSDEEREHARKIIEYINMRGSSMGHFNVGMPTATSWSSAREALQVALDLENRVNNELHALHKSAEHDCHDPQMQDFIESQYLNEQVESISRIERLITELDKFQDSHLGEYLINKDLAQ